MRNVVPRRALARRSRSFLTYAFFLFLLGILMLVVGVGLFMVPLVVTSNPNYALYDLSRQALIAVGGLLLVIAVVLAVRAVTWRTDNVLAESTGIALADFLDDDYLFVRNVSRRALGYIDAVLIGPPGALIFRIVDKDGVFYNQGRQWMQQRDKGEWMPLRWNPSEEAVDDVKSFRKFLQRHDLDHIQVWAVVVFTKSPPAVQVTTDDPLVDVSY
ncbi:MAG: NERD domain-containing protein, partial [Anaerolineae bacterium]|nr:NERD domain-containing protein [Anaerolineae bacterium]